MNELSRADMRSMAADYSISSLVDRIRGQRPAVPGGTRRDFFGDRVIIEAQTARAAEVRPLVQAMATCPSCTATVNQYAISCRGCGHELVRASA